ncbi:MAG: VOC family protein [Gemmatimonadaceae bacterium]|nr:VOC family protein [Gemmatimonadaceae bacterium]
MNQKLVAVALLVRDYDEAIAFFTQRLGFRLLQDESRGPQKRWVRIAPPGDEETGLLLARAATPNQIKAVGNQSGGRVMFFLHTDDFDRDYSAMKSNGIEFTEEPRNEEYGRVIVFKDLYGNKWDLIEPR